MRRAGSGAIYLELALGPVQGFDRWLEIDLRNRRQGDIGKRAVASEGYNCLTQLLRLGHGGWEAGE